MPYVSDLNCSLCFYVNDISTMAQDAETRFEDQVSKLVLEKQELEWEKVRLSLTSTSSTIAKDHGHLYSDVFDFVLSCLSGNPSASN